jgi:dipeptidyl aminopeptidase/acylaminoacyl peptidase
MKFKLIYTSSILFICAFLVRANATQRAMQIEDLLNCQRLSEPQFSPDGHWIAFTVKTMNIDANSGQKALWRIRPDGTDLQLLTSDNSNNWSPLWSPDGQHLAFLSDRSGTVQIWSLPLTGGEPSQITDFYCGVESFIWSHSGRTMAFSARVYPDLSNFTEMQKRDAEREAQAVKARIYDELMFRHWDEWWDHKRSHIFVQNLTDGKITDVTPGDFDTPPIALGEGYCFSPDDQRIIFNSNHDPVIAISTNNDLWEAAIDNPAAPTLITKAGKMRDFRGNDYAPQFSPDGKYLSFLSMLRPGFEADKPDLILQETASGKFVNLTDKADIRIGSYAWLPDSRALLLLVEERGRVKLKIIDVKSGQIKPLVEEGYNSELTIAPNGQTCAFLQSRSTYPDEIFVCSLAEKQVRSITNFNTTRLAEINMNPVEDFNFKSSDGVSVHGLLIKPPFFDAKKQYPAVFLVHGGPQGAWEDSWHYRWNLQLWAAQGYVTVMINLRGSTGYGQKFTDQISLDWGGQVFRDLVEGQKFVIANYKFINPEKLAAAGASYGGYMMNWIEGHMEDFQYPFQTLVNHDGSFNLFAMYLTTEELWFPEWEYGGPYWNNYEQYSKYSCDNFITNFKTPMLIIHGEQDFRLDFSQGLMVFTALRRRNVPAKIVLFPDEGHFVLKPQNSRFWHQTIFDWLGKYLQ